MIKRIMLLFTSHWIHTVIIIFISCILCVLGQTSNAPLPSSSLTFKDQRLAVVYPVIQNFKGTITSDPFGITNTWIGSDICKYKGFYCDTPPDNITAIALASIDFNGFQLSAPTLDGFIDQLPDLALFHANSNNFSGTISPKISTLSYLYELDLSNNLLSGVFPISVLTMPGLSFLDVRYNLFTGAIPPQVFLQNLDALFLNNNNFMQKLPDNLGATSALYLTLANNKFTGSIPPSIGNASSTLKEILLLDNMLSGCLPYELGFLNQIKVFDAGNNLLTGPLPLSLFCLETIEQLNLAGNSLYGPVPEILCALGNLVNLSLSGNYFTQVGVLCRRLVISGIVDLSKNCIAGLSGQRSVQECADFFSQQRPCPFPRSYRVIPCKIPPLLGGSIIGPGKG